MEQEEGASINNIDVIWKRKWIIAIGTISCMIIAGIFSFLVRPVYEIDTIIQPGKFYIQTAQGDLTEYVLENPSQIADKVRHRSYLAQIATELGIGEKLLPDIKGEGIRDTYLTHIWLRNHDIDLGKKVLNAVIHFIKEDIDEKIRVEINNIDSTIRSNEIEIEKREKLILSEEKKIEIVTQRKQNILKEMNSAKTKIDELEKIQISLLEKGNSNEMESLGMLLYSNEIQESLRWADILNEKLSDEMIKEEDIKSNIQNHRAEIAKTKNRIENLKKRKGLIDFTKIVKEPTSSLYPVFPQKKLNVLLAGFIGVTIFTLIVLFEDYIKRRKEFLILKK